MKGRAALARGHPVNTCSDAGRTVVVT